MRRERKLRYFRNSARPVPGAWRAGLLLSGMALASGGWAQEQENASPAIDGANRPRIGLVLSGGGARGIAHVGVLKALEELHVPIDAIAGTSMGAVVGGLYASGLTAREIEGIVTSLDWQDAFSDRPARADLNFRRKQEDQNFLVRFPLGLRAGKFLLPKGLVQGQKLNQSLRRLALPVSDIQNFDNLPTAFRAVATDLESGDPVVIGSGDLPSAMRASMSVPGVFAPVEREGRVLVDGGISENLPVKVARDMNVDVLIVVDVGFPLLPRARLNSVAVISNQMLAILVRRDSDRQRASLGERDVVIDPPLGDASSFDFGNVKRAIEAGKRAADGARERLLAYAVSPQAYEEYAARRDTERSTPPRIDFVHSDRESSRYLGTIDKLFGPFVGKPLDAERLEERVATFYGGGNLESLDYRLVSEGERRGLALSARRNSWGPNYVRFGLNLQDDFEGNSSYNAAARFVLSEITQPGGEWIWDLQIGETPRISTEIYLPLSSITRYFVMPHARFEARNVPVVDDQQRVAEYRVRGFEYGIDVGREFGNWGEVRVGARREEGRSAVRVGDPLLPSSDFDVSDFFVRLSYDRLDNVNFPRRGQLASVEWRAERSGSLSSEASDRIALDWLAARSFGRNTAVVWASAGSTLESNAIDVRSQFPLGGFLNLSGIKADSIAGPHYGIARMLLYRQIGRAGPGFLDVPTYLGMSLEAGNVWATRSDASFGSARKNLSVFLGLDTLIGPIYLASGFEDGGPEAFYLFLGRTF